MKNVQEGVMNMLNSIGSDPFAPASAIDSCRVTDKTFPKSTNPLESFLAFAQCTESECSLIATTLTGRVAAAADQDWLGSDVAETDKDILFIISEVVAAAPENNDAVPSRWWLLGILLNRTGKNNNPPPQITNVVFAMYNDLGDRTAPTLAVEAKGIRRNLIVENKAGLGGTWQAIIWPGKQTGDLGNDSTLVGLSYSTTAKGLLVSPVDFDQKSATPLLVLSLKGAAVAEFTDKTVDSNITLLMGGWGASYRIGRTMLGVVSGQYVINPNA